MEDTRLRLLQAATSGDVNDVIRMLDQDPSLATVVQKHIPVPLASAAGEGHVEVMRVLLDRGASPLGLPPDVPIVLASMSPHAEAACALLVEKGADVVARGLNGSTALTIAASTGNKEVVSLLLNHMPRGAVDMTNRWGESALWRAARFGHMAVTQTLLQEGGASSFAPDSRLDLSPQEAARQAGHNHLADHLEWFEDALERTCILIKACLIRQINLRHYATLSPLADCFRLRMGPAPELLPSGDSGGTAIVAVLSLVWELPSELMVELFSYMKPRQ